ncbi:alpha/beta hydrolase [Thalassotalea crassostreae]|uniref:alpha/beta hydrolase n=1 Tax=Thalassotalea crassostreae TaxID=1763536 RepID=UPI000838A6D5|nr:alpha/beta hydrolase [Thalassotalea crassostreae]
MNKTKPFHLKYIVLLLLVSIVSGCSGMFFYPERKLVRTPAEISLAYEDVYIDSTDGERLNGWFLKVEQGIEAKGTIYFLHGNAQNISHHIASVYWLPKAGYQVFMLDYRGYGRSTGTPVIPDVFNDIIAGFNYLETRADVANKPMYVLGQSLGASMSGYVVGANSEINQRLSAVVLDAGFTSYSDISQTIAARSWLTWAFQYPVAWSMPSDYDLIDVIANISPTPLLIIHGKQDRIIPYQHSQQLVKKAGQPKAMLSYNGAHIQTFNDVGNQQLLLEFLDKYKNQPKIAK